MTPRAEVALRYLFSFEVLAPVAVAVGCRGAAVRRAAVGRLVEDGLRLGWREHLSLGGLAGQRLHGLSGRAGGQVGAGADGASSPALLTDVRAVPRETLPVPRAFDLGRL